MLLRNNGQCPKCAGALRIQRDALLRCNDCKSVFMPYSDEGFGENELRYRERMNDGGLCKDLQTDNRDLDLGNG